MSKTICYDHLNNQFDSYTAMCEYYRISRKTFKVRLKNGWNLKDALTTSTKTSTVSDHLGNKYPDKKAMCEAYHINSTTFNARIKRGWTLKDALTKEIKVHKTKKGLLVTDHLGNTYPSKNAMCKAYNIPHNTFDERIKRGWSLEDALTKSVREMAKPIKDPLGREYSSESAMCRAYGIDVDIFSNRMKAGLTVE